MRAVAIDITLRDLERGRDVLVLGGEERVDLVLVPDRATEAADALVATVFWRAVIKQRLYAARAVVVAQIIVTEIDSGIDDAHEGAAAREAGCGAGRRSADHLGRTIELTSKQPSLLDSRVGHSLCERGEPSSIELDRGDLICERACGKAEGLQPHSAAVQPHGHERA